MKLTDFEIKDVEAWTAGGPPPPGSYLCKIADCKEGQSSGGHPQLELSYTVETGEYQGAEIRDWLVVVQATLGKVRALVEATGGIWPTEEIDPKAMIGRYLEVVTRREPHYKDPEKMVTKVAGYKPAKEPAAAGATGGNGKPADDDLPF